MIWLLRRGDISASVVKDRRYAEGGAAMTATARTYGIVSRGADTTMRDWFTTLAATSSLPVDAVADLAERGFIVVPGPVLAEEMNAFVAAYMTAMTSAKPEDTRVGTTSTRVNDFVNRGVEFDRLYVFPPLLEACCRIIGRPFKLSSLLARSLRPSSAAQALHVDVARDSVDWPLVGFILMIDEFRADNGATRFVPGSQQWMSAPDDDGVDVRAERGDQRLACGPAGSLVIFNGSTWHGHTANRSDAPRRSLQGAFIPRDGRAATDFAERMSAATRARLPPLAVDVLGV